MGLVIAEDIGPMATADRARIRIGGAESNLAIAATRLGASVAWVSRLGDDGLGDKIERTLLGEGVRVVAARDSRRPTGLMLKERRTAVNTRVSYYRSVSAATTLQREDIPDGLLAESRLVHVTGITPALSVSARDTVRDLVERAHLAGIAVSMDLNYRSALWSREDAATEFRALLPHIDVLFGGVDELAIVDARITSAESAQKYLSTLGIAHLVVKHGSEGASALTEHEVAHSDAYPVPVQDTVGAGDAFVAGYLTAWLSDASIADCLDQAARAGALACTVQGDWEGAPTRAELFLLDASDPVQR